MVKGYKRISVMLLTAVLALSMLSGCGSKKPAPEDAQAYVKAVLDLLCTGDYDHSVKLADVGEDGESSIRDELTGQIIAGLGDQNGLSEQTKTDFANYMISALEKARYTVGDAEATGDGEYDVTVSIEPLRAFAVIDTEEFDDYLNEKITADYDKVTAMSEEEQTNYVVEAMIELLNKSLEDPQYDEPVEVTVHYGKLGDKGTYGCTEEDGAKLGEQLFSTAGLDG